jgi:hypothetical protein
MSTSLPLGGPSSIFDRADGSSPTLGGVAEPSGALKINTATGNTVVNGFVPFWYEMSDSPEIESGEQTTIVHKYNCDYYTAQIYLVIYCRGTYLTDSQGNQSRVLSSRITPVPKTGMRGIILTITSEGSLPLFPNPPDEFDIETVELNPALEKHPRYSDLTYKQRYLVRNSNIVDNVDLSQQYTNLINSIDTSSVNPPGALQYKEAKEMLFKQHKGEESFYLAGYKITFTQYYWYPAILNPGGYIEDPVSQGSLPYYYWSSTGKPNGLSIFSSTATQNPNLYPISPPLNANPATLPPYGLSWLRQADTLHLNRTWWKITKTWIGGPLGHWDKELYSRTVQPYQTSEDSGSISF